MLSHKYLKNQTSRKFKIKKIIRNIIVIIIIVILFIYFLLNKSVNKAIFYQSKIISTNILYETTQKVLEDIKIDYTKIVTTKKDDIGKIVSIETDINEVNRIKSILTYEVTNRINLICEKKFYISIGTLFGNNIFSGRGKKIEFEIEPIGFLESDIKSEFTQAGINQTKHNILLNLNLNTTTIVPFNSACTEISTNMIIAETVIVGDVPQYYTNVQGADEKTIADINDYSHNK